MLFGPDFEYDEKKLTAHREFILRLQQKETRSAARNVKIILLPMSFLFKEKSDLVAIIYRPIHLTNPPYPTVLHIRGTGYNTSARYYSYITCSHLAEKSGCQVIDIDHRLAPEHPCPTAFNDVYASYKSIIHHAQQLHIDINKLAISGYSSGGNLAALTSIQAKKDKLPLALQILISPITDLSLSLKKFEYFENKDNFSSNLARWFIKLYFHLQEDNTYSSLKPTISPFWSSCLTNLPATYFLFGEFDRFRSDSEIYADKLEQFGFWTHKSIFKGGNHSVFWKDIRVTEVIATQLRMGLNLTTIERPSLLFHAHQKKSTNLSITNSEQVNNEYVDSITR